MKRSWQGPSLSVLCAAEEETINILFLPCLITVCISLDQLAQYFILNLLQLPPTANLLWSFWRYNSINKRDRVLWDLSAAATFWEIWRECNNKLFNDLVRSPDKLFISALASEFTGAITFQVQQGSRRLGTCTRRWWGGLLVDTQGKGEDADSDDTDRWRVGALIFGFQV